MKGKRCAIIFDEVQFFPIARKAIKYLVKDGRFDYIETGSLISIKKNVKDILNLLKNIELKCGLWILKYFYGRITMILRI